MITCRNCGHDIRRKLGEWKHRRYTPPYRIGGSCLIFSTKCHEEISYSEKTIAQKYGRCTCEKPEPIKNNKGDIR